MKRQTPRRLSKQEIQKRVLELETLYGQKNLANMLCVSVDSVRRYRSGKTTPQTDSIYKKLNRTYNKHKTAIDLGAVERKREIIEKRSKAQRAGKKKARFVPLDPEYMYYSPAGEFRDVRNFEWLLDLSEAGYVAGYVGGKEIPLEVQFVINGEDLTRWGKMVNIVGIVTTEVSPKEENHFTGEQTALHRFPVYYRLIRGLKKSLSFTDRMYLIRRYFFEDIRADKGYTVALLGFYFNEQDEI